MSIEPKLADAGIVFVGSFNPAILNPDWFLANDLIGQDEYEASDVEYINPDVSQFSIGEYEIYCTRTRLQVIRNNSPWILLSDLCTRLIGEVLPHTPLKQCGINRSMHLGLGSEARRNALGRVLAPVEPWGRWGAQIRGNEASNRSGLLSLSMIEIFSDHKLKRKVTATIQPSHSVSNNTGIYLAINDHYDVPEESGQQAADLLMRGFDASIEYSDWIAEQIMKKAGEITDE